MSWEFERVAGPFTFTEGPVWDGSGVLFTDIPEHRIMRYDVTSGRCTEVRTGTNHANGLKLGPDGGLYACEMGGRRLVRYEDDGTTVLVAEYEGARLNSPNDIAFDPSGRLWFTDPFYDVPWLTDHHLELDHRSVYHLDPSAANPELKRATTDTTNPNGLLVSPNGEFLYVAESRHGEGAARELRRYPIAADGSVGEYEVLHNFYPHRGIDGMCFDADGNIVATAGAEASGPGPLLYVFTPSGRVLETHQSPDYRPTNCCFGDHDLRSLYVTGYEGCLYRARTDRQGLLGPPEP
ncbi:MULTISPECIES: SMP-30/gluconolactonase/LRE family protein [unclassified Haladaptatus]|uniref:SMP-30/gluconolactonase/LRE family protein n=1 Tax=unclassified Haladaptatus TaxID=2622732 RepID=UPI0023E7E6E9|nr:MULTISPECIES: SMP-30/gluconolactonase/LRE family protein [unclassified Haladaptatus]